MKILLVGATGLVGSKLAIALAKKNHTLLVGSRRPSQTWDSIAAPHTSIQWPPKQEDFSRLSDVDAVVNLAGENIAGGRWTASRKQKILASRIESVRDTWQALAKAKAVPKVMVNASATGFYGDRGNEVLSESSESGEGFLSHTCQAWEKEVFYPDEPALFESTRKVALRIGLVLSTEGGALDKMLPAFQLNMGGRLGSGEAWMSWIHVQDLVAMILWSLENSEVQGSINACSPEPVQNTEFTKCLAKQLGRWMGPPAPSWALKLILGEMAVLLLQSQRVIPEKAMALGFTFNFSHLSEALADLLGGQPNTAHQLHAQQWVSSPVSEVFPFFCDEKNLERITPELLQFKVLGKDTPEIQEGTKINYRLKLHGIPLGWQSQILDWAPPTQFVDTQLSGPYKTWHHTHRFEALGEGTLMEDQVRYQLRFGMLGRILNFIWVKGDVQKIFKHRKKVVAEIFLQKGLD